MNPFAWTCTWKDVRENFKQWLHMGDGNSASQVAADVGAGADAFVRLGGPSLVRGGALVGGFAARGAAASRVANPLAGTRYTCKLRQQLRQSDYHSFPLEVDNFAGGGTSTTFTGGDGVIRTRGQLPGSYKGRDGRFEWIIEPDKTINHRLFVPNP